MPQRAHTVRRNPGSASIRSTVQHTIPHPLHILSLILRASYVNDSSNSAHILSTLFHSKLSAASVAFLILR